jgi:hypothetical protein
MAAIARVIVDAVDAGNVKREDPRVGASAL